MALAGEDTWRVPICLGCKHYEQKGPGLTCRAFQGRIPEEIVTSQFDHHQPHEGDHGKQFEPRTP